MSFKSIVTQIAHERMDTVLSHNSRAIDEKSFFAYNATVDLEAPSVPQVAHPVGSLRVQDVSMDPASSLAGSLEHNTLRSLPRGEGPRWAEDPSQFQSVGGLRTPDRHQRTSPLLWLTPIKNRRSETAVGHGEAVTRATSAWRTALSGRRNSPTHSSEDCEHQTGTSRPVPCLGSRRSRYEGHPRCSSFLFSMAALLPLSSSLSNSRRHLLSSPAHTRNRETYPREFSPCILC